MKPPPETPRSRSEVRKNPPRSAKQLDIDYSDARNSAVGSRIKARAFGLPLIASPGRLFPIQEAKDSALERALDNLTLGQNLQTPSTPTKKGRKKVTLRGRNTGLGKLTTAHLVVEEPGHNKENEDPQAQTIHNDEVDDESVTESDEENIENDDAILRTRQLTRDQTQLRNRILEFAQDRKRAECTIWDATPHDIQDVATEIERLANEGEAHGIFSRLNMLMLHALTFRQAMEEFSEAANDLSLQWAQDMKETVGMRDGEIAGEMEDAS